MLRLSRQWRPSSRRACDLWMMRGALILYQLERVLVLVSCNLHAAILCNCASTMIAATPSVHRAPVTLASDAVPRSGMRALYDAITSISRYINAHDTHRQGLCVWECLQAGMQACPAVAL